MRCLLVDDDAVARAVLEKYVGRHDGLHMVASCDSAVTAANLLAKGDVDLLFLDVLMPEMSGMELLRSLAHPPRVILVSARPEFAVEAFDFEVADYLLKPVTYARFLRAVERAGRVAESGGAEDTLFVKVEGRLVKVDLADLEWMEAQGDYVLMHCHDRDLLASTSMRKLEEVLSQRKFARVHRSYIVRMDKIEDIEESTIVIGRKVVPISSGYRESLHRRLNRA